MTSVICSELLHRNILFDNSNGKLITLDTKALQNSLPYHTMDTGLIYFNRNALGFGLHLSLKEPLTFQYINTLLSDLSVTGRLQGSFFVYKHHYETQQPQIYLFVSTPLGAHQHAHLQRFRERLERKLVQGLIQHTRINHVNFLVLLRSLISPTLGTSQWPGLIDIKNKPFRQIIPNPGTQYHLHSKHIDIDSFNAQGLLQKTRITPTDIVLPHRTLETRKDLCLWPSALIHKPLNDWVINLKLELNAHQSPKLIHHHVISINEPNDAEKHLKTILQLYKQEGLSLRYSKRPFSLFIDSLPLAYSKETIACTSLPST